MKKLYLVILICLVGLQTAMAEDVLKLVPFDQVRMDDVIWRPRIKKLVAKTLPHAFTQTKVARERLRLCAEYLESGGKTPKPRPHRFNTSDLYKVMEGAALMIQSEPNPEIEKQMDRIVDVIARAQQPDGYLYVSHITGSIFEREMGPRPYSHVIHSHELYNVGHLYEAAVAYAQATGKTKLLEVAEKSAAHVQRVIFEGDPKYNDGQPVMQAPGHQEIELGLVKLYNYTGKKKYLEMSKRFLDIRGVTFVPDGKGVNSPTYAQQHAPVARQTEAVGHAVRAAYQYAAMAEVDSLYGANAYSKALEAIWHNMVDTKMHITGGLGAVHGIEGFGPSYVLPNKHTYLETCAAVGNVLFNMRMFLKYRDAKYVDVAEIALLNNCLSGVGLDGTSFFYPNPLEADHGHKPRAGWFGTACCPSNIARLIPQVSGYLYAVEGRDVYCALYGANQTSLKIGKTRVALAQHTAYPFAGSVGLSVKPEQPVSFTLRLRIPTWTGTQIVPGALYAYTEPASGWQVRVNDKWYTPPVEKGFAVIERTWKAGDEVELYLPMPVKANSCIEEVEANRGRVAFSRGPLVYCAEGVDNGGPVQRFFVDVPEALKGATTQVSDAAVLAGLPVMRLPARQRHRDQAVQDGQLTLIPYFAWSNRDRSSMITWMGTQKELAEAGGFNPAELKYQAVSASWTFQHDTVEALRMPHTPKSSSDTSIKRWTSWPRKGQTHWVKIELDTVQTIKSVGVYFYDDKGGVQVPGAWWLEKQVGENRWERVNIYNTDSYSVLPDSYNTVHPAEPWKTGRIRIAMKPQHDQTCVGLLSVNVETE